MQPYSLKDRFSEISTWMGLALVAGATYLAMKVAPGSPDQIVDTVMTIAGAFGVAVPERSKAADIEALMKAAIAAAQSSVKAVFLVSCLALGALGLSACALPTGGTAADVKAAVEASVPAGFKYGCGALFYADGVFKAAAPALVVTGKLSQADVDKENGFVLTAKPICDNPPPDAAAAGLALVQQAGAILLMVAVQP